MSDIALEFNNVWKKFKKGEKYNSLRDLIPAMAKRVFSGNHREDLQKKEFWALKDVSFQVKRGEAIGIIGPNGAGKSTILKLLSGILRPNKGNIKVNGRLSALIEVGAGFHPDLTGGENIYLNGSILGMKRKEMNRKFDEIVAFSELEEFIDTPVKRFSSGMYARLGFSVAAHLDPDILLIDEVLSVGDFSFQTKCLEKIRNLKENGTTIVFISHNMEAIIDLCSRTVLLHKGLVLIDGHTRDTVRQYREGSYQQSTKLQGHNKQSPIRIKNVLFLDKNGEEKSGFASGEIIRIKITLEAREKVSEPIIGIAFCEENGFCLYGHNSKVDGYSLGDVHGTLEAEAVYENINLQPGRYFVTVAVLDKSAVNFYECNDRGYRLNVVGIKDGIGHVKLAHKWHNLEN